MATLPALSKTYSTRGNVPFAANSTALAVAQSLLYALKEHLKNTASGGSTSGSRHANSVWTTKGSSNGSSVSTAGVDHWSAHTSLSWASGGSNHSWWWGENATLGYQVVIDCVGGVSSSAVIAFAPIATPFTGGSLTNRPTSTQEFLWNTTSTGDSPVTFAADVVTGNSNFTHFVTADDGQFHFLVSRSGGTVFSTAISLVKTTGSTDTRNVFAFGHSQTSTRGAPGHNVTFGSNGCVGRLPNGTAISTGGLVKPTAGGSEYLGVGGTDALSGKYLAFPCDVMSLAGGQYAWRGRVPDVYSVGLAAIGSSIPSAAAQERVVAGDFILPFPGVVPTV